MKTLQKIWEYFFAPWDVTVTNRGEERWRSLCPYTGRELYGYKRDWVEYKYSHRFRTEQKIVKKYLN